MNVKLLRQSHRQRHACHHKHAPYQELPPTIDHFDWKNTTCLCLWWCFFVVIVIMAWGVVIMSSLLYGTGTGTPDSGQRKQAKAVIPGEDARIYGMKPSSLLSNISKWLSCLHHSTFWLSKLIPSCSNSVVTEEMTAMIFPLFRAIVDHTP